MRAVDSMAQLQADVFAGRVDPGEVRIARRIRTAAEPDVDTAEFSGVRGDYIVEPGTENPKLLTVTHGGGTSSTARTSCATWSG